MWIVRLALRRPYTFVVMAVLIAILGGIAIFLMPTDIFPAIDIPVVSVVWNYSGISPEGDGEAHRYRFRAHDHDDSRRYRAHRISSRMPEETYPRLSSILARMLTRRSPNCRP